MDVLPVVDCLVGVGCWMVDFLPEMDGQLSDVGEAGGVADVSVETPELGGGVLHQINAGKGVRICHAAAFDETLVGGFENGFSDGGIGYDSQAAEEEESRYACGFGGGCVRPDVNGCLAERTECLLEGEYVGKYLDERGDCEFDG